MDLTNDLPNRASYSIQPGIYSAPESIHPLSASESLWLDLVRGAAAQAVVIGHSLALLEIYPRAGRLNAFLHPECGRYRFLRAFWFSHLNA